MQTGAPSDLLPRLLLVADRFTRPQVAARVVEAARAGVPWIQLRDHEARDRTFERAADELLDALRSLSAPPLVSVNSRLAHADTRRTAFHTGVHGPTVAEAIDRLGKDAVVGASVHSVGEARRACEQDASYLTFSPVYATSSKPGLPGRGPVELERISALADPVPVMALGGVTPERVPECVSAGAYGVAVVRGILQQDDIERAVRLYFDRLTSR